ncbi:hypothetical protein JJB11_12200 [Ramlibacter ginsenosidimutans]|uniref:Uncharacterized protein n=1 Tax=Ramlibacter ginsenosidimutans TaxID=502333 RepID=A0A934TT25_9BURK|nr:hypothetical protein [Ramlibacter ginsenosidimutans]MBK6006853.1 hypothetical protein [Ramlibacter ginsenosidimutans]
MNPLESRRLFGTDEALAESLELRAGSLIARLRGTRLGPVTCEGHEVWHGIDFLYRDADWGTPAPAVDSLEHSQSADAFRARLRGSIAAAEIAFEIHIEADVRSVRYEATATMASDLATNRTGIVLMHPLAVCGRRVDVEHTDGRLSMSTFPTLIAPWPPFTLVRAVRHEYADGAWASCRFAGEDFELEDQRNNADASFKTYSRSNLMPRPYVLRAGTVLRQSVTLRIESTPAVRREREGRPVRVRIGEIAGALPSIGTALSGADLRAAEKHASALRALAPAHLQLCLEAGQAVDALALGGLLDAAENAALHLEIRGLAEKDASAQLAYIAKSLEPIVPHAVAVFPSTTPVLAAARRAFPQCRIGGGTPFFFTQLNRIEDLGACDFLCFGTAAVVHGADDEEIMAGLQSLPAMTATLRERHGEVPVHVGPSGIGAWRSPLGAQPASDGTRRLALARRDPRTRGLYGAAWAVGYIAQFAQAGAQAITLFDLTEGPVPAFDVLRRITQGTRWRRCESSDPASIAVLALEGATLLANLRDTAVDVKLDGPAGSAPIRIDPYETLIA